MMLRTFKRLVDTVLILRRSEKLKTRPVDRVFFGTKSGGVCQE